MPTVSTAATGEFSPGDLFAGRYRMVERLGQGRGGDVWRADDLVLGVPIALKLMRAESAAGRGRVQNDVRLARGITHPAMCRLYDIGEVGDQVFLSMELVYGEDLATLIHRVGRLPSEKVADIGRQLCDALAAAHAHGVLHRDLDLGNILIDDHGAIRITDFGIAPTNDTSERPPSEETDIRAVGRVLYELLVGAQTLEGADPQYVPPRPSTIASGVDPVLEGAVMDALASRPQDPSASAADLAQRLVRIRTPRPVARRRYGIIAATAVTVIAAALVIWRLSTRDVHTTLTEQDTILLADFTNSTGEPVFDGTLKVALAVALEQSPFIKVFPDDRVREVLRLMNRSPDERINAAVAREIARRERLKAFVTGSIASLGRNYVVALEAANAETGDVMAREQVEVAQKEQLLASLGQSASRLRGKLGESLASIQKYDVPLPRATTSSLEALHAYALGLDQDRLVARAGAIPHLNRAIELDPDFALAHALLSGIYANARQTALAPPYAERAFALRDRVSERERFFISWRYYHDALQDWDKAFELARTWTAAYPREVFAFNSLGASHKTFAQFDQAIEAFRAAARVDPSFAVPVENMAFTMMMADRLDDASAAIAQATVMRPDLVSLRRLAYTIAFARDDRVGMAREVEAAKRLNDVLQASDWEARTSAFRGQVQTAHAHYRRAVQLATHADRAESAAQLNTADAEVHAIVGQCAEMREEARAGLALSRDNFTLERAARALALCGDHDAAAALTKEVADRYPHATLTQRIQIPIANAASALHRGDSARALTVLDPVRPYDHARNAEFWPAYLRGQAFLAAKNGQQAAVEFDAIITHRGEAHDSMLYPLAYLGAARAAAMTGDVEKARSAYATFFKFWDSSDQNLPPLVHARREAAALR